MLRFTDFLLQPEDPDCQLTTKRGDIAPPQDSFSCSLSYTINEVTHRSETTPNLKDMWHRNKTGTYLVKGNVAVSMKIKIACTLQPSSLLSTYPREMSTLYAQRNTQKDTEFHIV